MHLKNSPYYYLFFACIVFLGLSCEKEIQEDSKETLFKSIESEQSGIDFINSIENSLDLNILNYLYFYNGGGIAVADFNNDQLPDLYFTANQTADRLYLNLGQLQFKDISDSANIDNSGNFTTGVTTVDINNDGLLDIYVCRIGDHNNISGSNRLFVNQGIGPDGNPSFKEEAAKYNLDISTYATQAVFFDYDLDNDLDMFLLNHSVHPNSNYGRGANRTVADTLSGDRLYENIDGLYKDVSSSSGIFQGKIGYGLGVSIGDLNNDGYPDIYVGNDFFENDYLYINNKDKTFTDIISSPNNPLGHTTHFSMGNTINDLDNDGNVDILSLDMLPENLNTYKTSGLEYSYPIYQNYLRNGYAPQYMQNTLHRNNGTGSFSEISFASGIAATEWSWSPLVADFNNDTFKDIYITNGILGATNDMDFINFISNEHIQKRLGSNMGKKDLELIEKIPKKKLNNYIFKNNGDNTFSSKSEDWLPYNTTYSNGAVYADLDLDGDLDIVVNNVNDKATLLENTIQHKSFGSYLKVGFKGPRKNLFGIGSKVMLYLNDQLIKEENFTTNGYLSAVEPTLHFGLGNHEAVDSLVIIWPDAKYETLRTVDINKTISLTYANANGHYYQENQSTKSSILTNTEINFPFLHIENSTLDFNRDPLIPYATTNEGPDISVADFNNDGRDDLFISGAKGQASALFYNKGNQDFEQQQGELFAQHSLNEDIAQDVGDIDNNGYNDIIVVSGGNEFKSDKPIRPRIYYNDKGVFSLDTLQFKNLYTNASKVRLADFDADGYLDVLITSNTDPEKFGKTPNQYLLINDGQGNFADKTEQIAPDLRMIGNVKDLAFEDMDGDGQKDIVMAGHWMPITILYFENGKYQLRKQSGLEYSNGWWNCIEIADFDKDGDLDIIAGNWGLNSRLVANKEEPITLYSYDFDKNGSIEPLLTYVYNKVETPFASKDELAKQMPFVNKDYLSYKDFAEASLQDIFGKENLAKADKKFAYELGSCYFENLGQGKYKKRILPFTAQLSSVNDILVEDFNEDGYFDVLLTGNNYEISTQLSRLDASHGDVLLNDKNGGFEQLQGKNFDISGAGRVLKKITIDNSQYIIVGRNNDSPLFLKLNLNDQ